jgi:hypothetical protein
MLSPGRRAGPSISSVVAILPVVDLLTLFLCQDRFFQHMSDNIYSLSDKFCGNSTEAI